MQQERLQGMSSGTSSSGSSTPIATYRSVHYATLPEEKSYAKAINSKSRSSSSSASYRIQYRVYRWRWLMLAALCALNVSNGMVRRPPCVELVLCSSVTLYAQVIVH